MKLLTISIISLLTSGVLLTITFMLPTIYPNNVTAWSIVGLTGFTGILTMLLSAGISISLIIKKKYLD